MQWRATPAHANQPALLAAVAEGDPAPAGSHHLAVGWAMCCCVGVRGGCAREHMQLACSGGGGSDALVRTPESVRSWNEGALPHAAGLQPSPSPVNSCE